MVVMKKYMSNLALLENRDENFGIHYASLLSAQVKLPTAPGIAHFRMVFNVVLSVHTNPFSLETRNLFQKTCTGSRSFMLSSSGVISSSLEQRKWKEGSWQIFSLRESSAVKGPSGT
jgi:hypothetical protein